MRTSHLGHHDVRPVPVWIYALVESDTGEIRYIGKSQDPRRRLANHQNDPVARRTYDWSRAVAARGAEVRLLFLREVPPGEDVDLAEREELAKRRELSDLLNVYGRQWRSHVLPPKAG